VTHDGDFKTANNPPVDTGPRVVWEIPHWLCICGMACRGALVGLIPFAFTPVSTFISLPPAVSPAYSFLFTAPAFFITTGYQTLYWGGGKWWRRFSVLRQSHCVIRFSRWAPVLVTLRTYLSLIPFFVFLGFAHVTHFKDSISIDWSDPPIGLMAFHLAMILQTVTAPQYAIVSPDEILFVFRLGAGLKIRIDERTRILDRSGFGIVQSYIGRGWVGCWVHGPVECIRQELELSRTGIHLEDALLTRRITSE